MSSENRYDRPGRHEDQYRAGSREHSEDVRHEHTGDVRHERNVHNEGHTHGAGTGDTHGTGSGRRHLYYLDELSGYKVASDDPDVRGWKVTDATGETVGKVNNLLVSKEARRVRYLDVAVDRDIIEEGHRPFDDGSRVNETHEFVNREGENHLIIPIGMVTVDTERKHVHTETIDRNKFARTKRFAKNEPVPEEYEVYVVEQFCGDRTPNDRTGVDDSFYDREEFDDTRYRRR